MKAKQKFLRLTPAQNIMAGFALMILTGALLLTLPVASASGESVGFLNALFTATSANCVTGLVVVNTLSHWTWFGKAVILLLIQFGAWGAVTLTTAALLLAHRKISLRDRQVIQAAFNQNDIGGMVRLIRRVMLFSLLFEGAGAVLLALCFAASAGTGPVESVIQGVFHAVSAFCNAGFDNLGPDSLTPYQTHLPVNGVIMALIVSGGLGFTVWGELFRLARNPQRRSFRVRAAHLSLQAKMVLSVTAVLILSGAALFLLLEASNPETLGPLGAPQKALAALFHSVSLRTAGFNTVSQGGLTDPSKVISCILMLIGGSPASTAGGFKTVTLGVIYFSMLSVLRGRRRLEAGGRSLPLDLLQKALTVVTLMLVLVFVSALLLHFTEQATPYPHSFLDLLFECCSAAGTVGVTTGITPYLSPAGKLILIVCMFVGRLGPVTAVVALNAKLGRSADVLTYPEEQVLIG